MSPSTINLLGMGRAQLMAYFQQLGERSFRTNQVLKWVHQHGCDDVEAMTNLSKDLRGCLSKQSVVEAPEVVEHTVSSDGTRKWLLRVDGGNCIEMVFIPEDGRGTLCISSQVGCALNCSFCSTARQGFNRNLESSEIVGQLWLARKLLASEADAEAKITNVVLMGMGEPLLNFDNVIQALDLMLEDCAYGLARRRVTLSTAGVVPAIYRLGATCPVSLAVSLHAAYDELRDDLVPINRKYPIDTLLTACRDYVATNPKQKVTFEYVMLKGINDRPTDARLLARLLSTLPAKVNLIPFNPFPGSGYHCSPRGAIDEFRDILLRADVLTMTRKTRGQDIDAACGQLAGRVVARGRSASRIKHSPHTLVEPPHA